MTSKYKLITAAIVAGLVVFFSTVIIINSPPNQNNEEKRIFPDILGDMVLRNNETGIYSIRNITSYDDFQGNIMEGFKAEYSGSNGTMIIYIAKMPGNNSALVSLKDMVIRAGYDPNIDYINNTNITNWTVMKLPVNNPEVYVIQKNRNHTWHYTFAKMNKVYWVGFSSLDIQYQESMLVEVYRNVAEKIDAGI